MPKSLVIVESPAKARTIAKFLGKDFVVESSIGHIRDLPSNADEVPAAWKEKNKETGRLGIDIENDFSPIYVVPPDKKSHIRQLKKLVAEADVIYLATDEDREGESISWHLTEVLKPKGSVHRLVFHEITREAIQRALDNPRDIHLDLVEAQETRRLVDRLYGYVLSPLLWKKVRPRLSAGRVQSVAVRLVVERERDRMRFKSAGFWDLDGTFGPEQGAPFEAGLATLGQRRVASGKDFDPDTGEMKASAVKDNVVHLREADARALADRLSGKPARVAKVEAKPFTERPSPPFTTSTLQQAAGRRLGFTAKRTMRAAQALYQHGYITYMRTDSTALSQESLKATRTLIRQRFGDEHVPDAPRTYKTKVKNAQEAHEAIRPAGSEVRDTATLGSDMGSDERRVYELIWQRTVACQMKDALGMRTVLSVDVEDARFQTSGKTITFPGFRLAYAPAEGKSAEAEKILPDVVEGQQLETLKVEPQGHATKPPARLTEATLVKELEARGIGRPSTYADIIDKIQAREYCFKRGQALVPTITSFAVTDLLDKHMGHLIDYEFTAKMENDLDEISNGRKQRLAYLESFYHGNGMTGLKTLVDQGLETIDPRLACSVRGFDLADYQGEPVDLRVGRYAAFLAAGEVKVSLPEEMAPDELTAETAGDLLHKASLGDVPLGQDPESGLDVYKKTGRFGTYVQLGDAKELPEGQKPKTSSLLPTMTPDELTLEQALQLLSLPRVLGTVRTPDTDDKPGTEQDVIAQNGRYGPYLKWGKETRSVPSGEDVLTISLERALAVLREPKQRRGRAAAKVLKELGEHPESGAPVNILDGRYGPYVSDGETNASVPKGTELESVGMAQAVELLTARAAKTGKKKRTTKKKVTKKKTAKKKTTKKKAVKKKTTKSSTP